MILVVSIVAILSVVTSAKPDQLERPDFSEPSIDKAVADWLEQLQTSHSFVKKAKSGSGHYPEPANVETGMDLMKTRRLVRRSFLTAAVSTASLLATLDSQALGFEITVSPSASRIQRVQYQPGQQGQPAQANPAVTAELKKMFEESGQPMPSMNPRDLPNAQGQQMNNVRPTQRPAGQQTGKPQSYAQPTSAPKNSSPQAGMQQASTKAPAKTQQPAKRNFLQKFMGGITGQTKKAAEAAVVPPVPPGYVEPPPAPPSGGSSVAQAPKQQGVQGQPAAMQNRPSGVQAMPNGKPGAAQNGMQSHLASQSRPMPATNARPAVGSQSQVKNTAPQNNAPTKSVPVRTAQATSTTGQARAASQPTQPVPAVPVTASSQPRNPRASAPPEPVANNQNFVQPGTAPAFMPSVKKNLNEAQATIPQVKSPVTAQSVPNPKPVMAEPKAPAKPNEDGFVDPFSESELAADANDSLDLDSLVAPKVEETVQAVKKATTEIAEKSSSASASAANSLAENPFVEEAKALAKEAAGNPLTGVQLNTTDEEMFSADSAKTIVKKSLPAAETAEALLNSVPSVEEFEQSLPAIDLPTVDEAVDAATTELSTAPDINFPELDAQDAAEAQGNTPLVNTPQLQESVPPVAAEASGTPLRSVDAERLQQIAEQDRRSHQQRLIQSRSGQAGFKGFCPVELRDRRELIDTNPQFTAAFGLQTYTFSSAEAKAAFEADPSRYAPAAGGSDVVLLVNSGEEEQGMLDYALWYRDRLYLFRSRETMAMFNKDPQRFANQY
jgi:YHS domain-containing protein